MARVHPQPPHSGPVMKQIAKLVATPAGAWYFTRVAPRFDRFVIPLTRGKLRMTLSIRTVVLINRGAKSGELRHTPLVYFTDGDDVILIGSNGGYAKHPAWYHNVLAHPDVELSDGKVTAPYRGREAEGTERQRLWTAGLNLYPGWATYQARAADRRLPVMVFTPAS